VFLSWLSRSVWDDAGIDKLVGTLLGEQKTNIVTIPDVPIRDCKVSVIDMDGIEHTAQVSASTLYEAIALGLRAIKKSSWAGQIPEGLTTVTVHTTEDPIEHSIQMQVFKKWLARGGGSPSDRAARARVREILWP
jgi:hypothetical protein